MNEQTQHRLFFALWPDPGARSQLLRLQDSLRSSVEARWVLPVNLHLTLTFIGQVTAERLQDVREVAASAEAEPFSMWLNGLECWRSSRALCLTPKQVPTALNHLVETLATGLDRAGFELDKRPYRPHLTLARQTCCDQFGTEAAVKPIRFNVSAFHLVESSPAALGPVYEMMESWALGGD